VVRDMSSVPSGVRYALAAALILLCCWGVEYVDPGSTWFGSQRLADQLRRHGIETWGAVTATYCWNHGALAYQFRANGSVYVGHFRIGTGVPPCNRLSPGDTIPVSYSPSDPTVNAAGHLPAR